MSKNLSNFNQDYWFYKNGKNKDIRNKADRKIENTLKLAGFHIRNNEEAFALLTDGENKSAYGRQEIYKELLSFNYFSNDMNDFLKVIRDKIQSFGD